MTYDPSRKDWSILVIRHGKDNGKFVDFIRELTHKEMLNVYEGLNPAYKGMKIHPNMLYEDGTPYPLTYNRQYPQTYNRQSPKNPNNIMLSDQQNAILKSAQEKYSMYWDQSCPTRIVFGPEGWDDKELKKLDEKWPLDYYLDWYVDKENNLTRVELREPDAI